MRFGQILIQEGIQHIEDLAVDEFIDTMRSFNDYEISEKVDGSNIQFGIDENGFYTSREEFGGKRVYDVGDYPINFSTTFMRSAHAALEQVLDILIDEGGLSIGDRIDSEVLYGELPNAIRYTNESNRIILLRVIDGDANISKLRKSVDGKKVTVSLEVPYTLDGKEINTATETNVWSFEQTPIVSGDQISSSESMAEINELLDELGDYLKKPSGIGEYSNSQILALPLNKRPDGVSAADWKELKETIKEKKIEVQKEIYYEDKETGERSGYKTKIKDKLLNDLVRKTKSAFGPKIEDGGWIEGVVLRHKKTGNLVKVVDKDIFTTIKDFLWKVRKELSENPSSVNKIESFLGKLMAGLSSSIGHPALGTTQAKRYLKSKGSTPEEILSNIASSFNYDNVKNYWVNFISQQKDILDSKLDDYQDNKGALSTKVDFGDAGVRTFKYDEEIDKRTLQVFSSLYKRLDDLESGVKSSTSAEDLVMLLVGKQLGEI